MYHHFTLVFNPTDIDFESLADKLYEAGCDDGLNVIKP